MRFLFLAIAAITLFTACDKKGVTHDLESDKYIAIINDVKVPISSLDSMTAAMNKGQVKHDKLSILQGVIENELVAEYALDSYGQENLIPVNRVAFEFDVTLEDQYISIMRTRYEEQLLDFISKELPNGNLTAVATKPFTMKRSELKPLTKLRNRGGIGFSPEQQEEAKKVILVSYQFPGAKEQHITLYDIYRRQNIQGKDLLNKADTSFLRRQVHQRLGSLFVHYWLAEHSGLNQEELDAVEKMVFNKEIKQLYMVKAGLVSVLHGDASQAFKDAVAAVTQEEITSYYNDNKEEYKQRDRVRGRHLKTQDQATAQKAYDELIAGKDFNEVVKTYSQAPDIETNPTGDTGWVTRQDNQDLWLQTLLFTQELGTHSKPIRSPQTQGVDKVYWEIVIVDEIEESYPKPDSEGIRYEVSQIVAKKNLVKAFKETRKELLENSYIQLNGELLGLNEKEGK